MDKSSSHFCYMELFTKFMLMLVASGWKSKMPGSGPFFSSSCWALLSRFTTSQWRARFLVAIWAPRRSSESDLYLPLQPWLSPSLPSPAPQNLTALSPPGLSWMFFFLSFWMLLSPAAFSAQPIPMWPSCLSLTSPFPDLLLRQLDASVHRCIIIGGNLSTCPAAELWLWAPGGEERLCLVSSTRSPNSVQESTWEMRARGLNILYDRYLILGGLYGWALSGEDYIRIWDSKWSTVFQRHHVTYIEVFEATEPPRIFEHLLHIGYCATVLRASPWFPLVILIFISTLWPLVWQWGDSWAKRLNSFRKVAQLIAGGQRSHRSCLAASTQG